MKRVAIILLSLLPLLTAPTSNPLAATWTVKADGTGDAATIQGAIFALAAPGDTILLEPGTYTGIGNKNIDYLGRDLVILGNGNPGDVVIDCQGDGRAFDFNDGETPAARVENITMINGDPSPQYGGAIRFSLYSSPTISRCRMENNAAGDGGAIWCWQSSPVIEDCEMVSNATAEYGSGGAMSIGNDSAPLITGCWIEGNTATFAGGIETSGSDPVIEYCTFVNNTCAQQGGGIGCQYGAPLVRQCTIVANTTADSSGGIFCYQADMDIICTIVAFSQSGAGVWCFGDCSNLSVAGTDIFGNPYGDWIGCVAGMDTLNGNFWTDPLFCDGPGGDYTLAADSPLLGAGAPCDGFVGAWDEGCGMTAAPERFRLEPCSWTSIKTLYR